MVSAEIQFTEEQMAALQQMSAREGRSVEDIVRANVEQMLNDDSEARTKRMLSAIGTFRAGRSDIGRNHDKYLAEDFL